MIALPDKQPGRTVEPNDPAQNSPFRTVQIGKIWCAVGSPIEATPDVDRTGWDANTRVTFELLGPDAAAAPTATVTLTRARPAGATLRATADAEGFHALRVTASDLPARQPRAGLHSVGPLYRAAGIRAGGRRRTSDRQWP